MQNINQMSSDLYVPRQGSTLRHLVEEKLRVAIAQGRFAPGKRLVERELCELFGVGRTSVREALRQLEAEGLIVTVPHRGPMVSRITLEEARELYDFRILLEGFAGRRFALRRTDEHLTAMAASIKRLRKAASTMDHGELLAAKAAFYQVLLDGCGNRLVTQSLTSIHNRINMLRARSMSQPGRIKRSLVEIKAIYNAVDVGDADAAEFACRAHIVEAGKVALRILSTEVNT